MTASAARVSRQAQTRRHPVTYTQRFFLGMDEGEHRGAFGDRHLAVTAWRVWGAIDIGLLQSALDGLVARHEVLRTLVHRDPHDPHQLVFEAAPPVPLHVETHDVPSSRRDLLAEQLLVEAESAQQSARQLPLLRAELHRFGERDHLLVLSVHHSASDGWSMQLLHDDVAVAYAAGLAGHEPQLPAAVGYTALARWERSAEFAERAIARRAHWRGQLAGARVFTLRADNPVLPESGLPYVAVNFEVDAARVGALASFAAQHRTSLFMVLFAAFCAAVTPAGGGRADGSAHAVDDLTVMTISAARGEPWHDRIVGPMLNFVPLRVRVGDRPAFGELLQRVRRTCLQALDNDLPFTEMIENCPDTFTLDPDPRACPFAFEMVQPPLADRGVHLGERSTLLSRRLGEDCATSDLPNGVLWNMERLPDGAVVGAVVFNPGHFRRATVTGLVDAFVATLARTVSA